MLLVMQYMSCSYYDEEELHIAILFLPWPKEATEFIQKYVIYVGKLVKKWHQPRRLAASYGRWVSEEQLLREKWLKKRAIDVVILLLSNRFRFLFLLQPF